MKLVVLGTADDVRGFALAGVAGVRPVSGREVEEQLAAAAGLDLILLSSEVAALAPQAVAAARSRAGGPLILILPGASETVDKGGARADAGERGGAVRRGA